ncbi:MAG: phosphate/phosphite/phosphonate ABC transporter substrate-binding protein [Armatimonadota bacterium]|nr:phosphate/phosphite/phosphonate ABC transporter substrate-binding protein [Armatimonadota bacterium]MDR7451764.1 phosphate/phosphite/phosphonate ABC transporter substrate-binding protein [Armatimonadota bacterium]MDR7467389.1 phosphate/phosphite/phosphonate ABC transporter substrate-binding protein [Armatimonadota bacterium]MDR7494159.1 phosphate/phosphite/phosphonate ABC transporter substrate-binding protein [Armatimonadota bacterium]MDR7498875.1 phosphate/phosphite/phosphonate ABC transpor
MRQLRYIMLLAVALAVALTAVALPPVPAAGQTKLVMVFVPSRETDIILFSGQQIGRMLGVALGVPVEAVVSTSYTAAIEAMCAGRADIGALNPFSYVLAHQKCNVEVAAISVRFGLPYYRAQISVRADANINKIEDLRGKRFAFVDPASTSGYLFPAAMLKKMGYDPDRFFSQTVFAGSHPNVILAIYRGQVDGGATFEDARTNIQAQFPDVMQKVKVIGYTNPIPNDTWSLSARLSPELRARIKDRLLRIATTPEGKEALRNLYSIEGLTDRVVLSEEQVRNLGIRFDEETRARIVRAGGKVTIPIGDWYFQPIRDAATYLGLDLAKLAR